MTYSKIKIGSEDHGIGRVGGGAWLKDAADWPLDGDGAAMLPLISFDRRFFAVPMLPDNFMLTVFVPLPGPDGFTNGYAESLGSEAAKSRTGSRLLEGSVGLAARVLLHEQGAEERRQPASRFLPPGFLELEPMNDEELRRELADEANGSEISKRQGREYWLRDFVRVSPRYSLLAQLNEAELAAFDSAYRGIFGGGIGYVYLDYRVKKAKSGDEAGIFFVQRPVGGFAERE